MFIILALLCLAVLSMAVFFLYRWSVRQYDQKVIAEFQESQSSQAHQREVRKFEADCLEAMRLLDERRRANAAKK